MTNLADLLPAGGGQNNTDFVADGNISAGVPVVLTAAGKAAAITGSGGSVGTSAVFESATSAHMSATYDSTNNKIVICYRDDGNSYYGTAVVATVSGNSISFGTPAVFSSSSTQRIAPVFDTYRNRVVIIYKNDGDGSKPYGISGAVSGTSISFATAALISGNSCDSVSACFDSVNNQTIFSYARSASDGQTGAATVDAAGAIGYGSTATFVSGGAPSYTQTVFDPDTSKAVVFFTDSADSYKGKARVITNSSGTITFGTVATMDSSAFFLNTGVDYDTSADKMVIAFADQNTSNYGFALVGTVSGTDITFGTITQFVAGNMSAGSGEGVPVIYDPDTNKSIVAFKNATDGDIGQFTELTVSGTSVTGGSATTFQSGSGVTYVSGAYDTNANKTVLAYTNLANSNYGTGVVITPNTSTLTSTNLLGLAPEAISDTATGTINTWGSRCESTKLAGTGFSMGATVQFAATNLADINASQAVFDSTNNKMVIVYDGAGSGAGYGVVGTISGTSISYGSAVQFSGGNAHYNRAAYDSTNQRVVVAYRDTNNSNYGTAVVGTVSGTSISWGTPVAFESSAVSFTCVSFDSNEGKVVITWKNDSTAYATSIVGTVSGTSISFGSAVIIDTSYGYNKGSVTYDPNAQRHLYIAERTSGSVTDSYVGTVSGTSISWGSAVSLTTTQYFYDLFSAYEAPSQKLGVVFTNASDSTLGTLVATISGSSVSYGSLVNIGAGAYTAPGIYYDATAAEFVVQGVLSSDLLAYRGTLSGTTISWGAAQTVAANADFGYGVGVPGYDTNAGKGLFQWANAAGTASDSGVASIGDLDLTVTSDYYVQTDGTISTTSTSPAQLIGKAIKTNQINIKDYTG